MRTDLIIIRSWSTNEHLFIDYLGMPFDVFGVTRETYKCLLEAIRLKRWKRARKLLDNLDWEKAHV